MSPTKSCWAQRLGWFRLFQCALIILLSIPLQTGYARTAEADIDLEVPIKIEGLTAFIPGAINTGVLYFRCKILDAGKTSLNTNDLAGTSTKYWQNIILDASGNFSGTRWWGVRFWNPNDFAKAKFYECRLWGNKGIDHVIEIGDGSSWWHAKSGTPIVTGPIP